MYWCFISQRCRLNTSDLYSMTQTSFQVAVDTASLRHPPWLCTLVQNRLAIRIVSVSLWCRCRHVQLRSRACLWHRCTPLSASPPKTTTSKKRSGTVRFQRGCFIRCVVLVPPGATALPRKRKRSLGSENHRPVFNHTALTS